MPHTGIISSHQKSIDFAQRCIDLGLIVLAWWIASPGDRPFTEATALLLCLMAMSFELTASLSGVYNSQRSQSLGNHLMRVALTLAIAFSTLAVAAYASTRLLIEAPRFLIMQWAVLSALLLCGLRLLYRPLLEHLRSLGLNTRTAAVVGNGDLAKSLLQRLEKNPWMGITVIATYDLSADTPQPSKLLQDARDGRYDHIYLALPLSEQACLQQLISNLSDTASSVYLIPDVFTFDLLHSRTHLIDGLPAISIYDTPFSHADQLLKRSLDIIVSLIALFLLSPILIAIAIAIKATSSGTVFFKQTRYGLNGRPIKVWKFRSMKTMDDGAIVKQAQKNDSRLTPIGGFLRSSSLDELPQFINVLGGSMSVVGPRPHAVAHNEMYRELIPGYMLRHKVKPGITGWAQINGWRGETDTLEKMQKRIEFDIEYIRRWSIWLDIKIIWLTAFKGFFGSNAY